MTPIEPIRGSREELDERAADGIARSIGAALQRQSHVVLGVVGGRSVGGIYESLAARELPWERIHVFLADERLVPPGSAESNFRVVEEDLLAGPRARGLVPAGNAHRFPYTEGEEDAAVAAYDLALEQLGGRFDVVVLSAGEDGHTASLFPDHPSVRAKADGFVLVESSPKPPPRRVSASRRLLERTPFGVLVLYGDGKREALAALVDPQVSVEACPSKVVESMPERLVVTDIVP